MYYPLIDVHKRGSHVALLDDDREVIEKDRVQNANLEEIAEEYGSQAAIEATGNYSTIYEFLIVVVADPQQTKAIGVG